MVQECGGLCAAGSRRPYKSGPGDTAAAVLGGKASQRAGFNMGSYPLKNSMNFRLEQSSADLNTTTKSEQNFFDSASEEVASALNMYYTPLLIVLGAIGNLLSVFVFYRSKLRFQSTSQYLSALALSDTIFLLQLLPPWLNAIHFTGLFHQEGFCQFFVYISYVTCTFSAWIVVGFTVERFVAVLYPLQRNAVCTIRRARYIIAGIALGSLLLNVPVLRFAVPTPNDCNIDYEYLVHAARFNLVDTAVSFTVPLAAIIVLNTWIMVGVCRLERARQQLMNAEQIVVLGNRIQPVRQMGCPRSQQRVTRMLLIVSSVYVILNLPAYTLRIIAYAYNTGEGENSTRWAALQQVALIFFNTNFGINFILYCLSGQNFRRALKNSMPRIGNRIRRALAARRDASSNPADRNSATTSFISHCNEANNNCDAQAANHNHRHRREEHFITRWTFDNSRQRRMQGYGRGDQEMIELQEIGAPSLRHRFSPPLDDEQLGVMHPVCSHRYNPVDMQPDPRCRCLGPASRDCRYYSNDLPHGNHRCHACDPPRDRNRFHSIDPPHEHDEYHPMEPQHYRNRFRSIDQPRDYDRYRSVNSPPDRNRFRSIDPPLRNHRFRSVDPPLRNHRFRSIDPPVRNDRFRSVDPTLENDQFRHEDSPVRNQRFRSFDPPPRCIRHS